MCGLHASVHVAPDEERAQLFNFFKLRDELRLGKLVLAKHADHAHGGMHHILRDLAYAGSMQHEVGQVRARKHGRLYADFPIRVSEPAKRALDPFRLVAMVFRAHGRIPLQTSAW
ncbi:hypothetical protein D3C71_1969940 [compost metagenome]